MSFICMPDSLDMRFCARDYPDTTALTYAYDNANHLTSITQGGASVVSYTYDAANNRTGKNLANGVTSTLTYDNVERLTSITDLTPSPTAGTLLQKFQYGYDAMSRRTYVKRNNGVGDVYGYDTANQLTSVKYNCTNPDTTPTNPSQTVTYTYDNAGNRTQVVDSLNGTSASTPNADNQYTTVGSNTATYDVRGNLTALGGTTYGYDASNRLISYGDSFANSVTQAYDPLGRCVKRTINGTTSFFVYDLGWRLLCDYNSSGGRIYRYVNGPASNEIVSRTDSSNVVVYYHTDGLGSITKLTSSTGAVLEQYSYDAFGKTTIQNASGATITASAYANRFMYTGAEYVSPTGLYNNRNRFYSPSLGRFLQPDPIGHGGDGYNIYRYCGNNPVNGTDPSGLYNGLPHFLIASNPQDVTGSGGGIADTGISDWLEGSLGGTQSFNESQFQNQPSYGQSGSGDPYQMTYNMTPQQQAYAQQMQTGQQQGISPTNPSTVDPDILLTDSMIQNALDSTTSSLSFDSAKFGWGLTIFTSGIGTLVRLMPIAALLPPGFNVAAMMVVGLVGSCEIIYGMEEMGEAAEGETGIEMPPGNEGLGPYVQP